MVAELIMHMDTQLFEHMVNIFENVLDRIDEIDVVKNLHNQTRDLFDDGVPNIKDRFFKYMEMTAMSILREGILYMDPNVLQEAVNMLRRMIHIRENWQD